VQEDVAVALELLDGDLPAREPTLQDVERLCNEARETGDLRA